MLARYRIVRGKRSPDEPLPEGIRQDTRFRTSHCLRPTQEIVETYLASLADGDVDAWDVFENAYVDLLEERYREDRMPFDELARLAHQKDVHLGCNCPTQKNPNVLHCHTIAALRFMKGKYPKLVVKVQAT